MNARDHFSEVVVVPAALANPKDPADHLGPLSPIASKPLGLMVWLFGRYQFIHGMDPAVPFSNGIIYIFKI
jgi:hypothetical protein